MIKVTKLAHVGLNAVDLSSQAEFDNDRWGLERIDEHGGEMFFRSEGPAPANSGAGAVRRSVGQRRPLTPLRH
jgi:hypothetical protein